MALRDILIHPDPRLKSVADPVADFDDGLKALADDMLETMYAAPGIGLAAPQIGIMLRLAVVDCSEDRGRAIRLANPEIVASSEETFEWEEASPNLPGYSAWVTRPMSVTVAFTTPEGHRLRQDFEELWATSVQHQIDHLNGKMFFERLSRTKRQMFLKKVRKAR